jgi:hypothetical protein
MKHSRNMAMPLPLPARWIAPALLAAAAAHAQVPIATVHDTKVETVLINGAIVYEAK